MTDKELSASNSHYRDFIRNSSEGIWRFELEEPIPTSLPADEQIRLMYKYGFLAEANPAMAEMYGFDNPAELQGARLGELLVRDDPQNVSYLEAFIKHNYRLSGVESQELDRFGNKKFFRNSLVGFIEEGMLYRAWGTQQDITDEHQATKNLERSQERLNLALDAAKMGIWEWHVAKNELMWSDRLRQIFGLDKDAKVNFEIYQKLLHPDDAPKMHRIIEEAVKTGKSYTVEHRVVWPDGSVHWIRSHGKSIVKDGKTVRLIGTASSADRQKQTEIDLRESEKRFRAMADAAPVMIWETDLTKKITYLNKSWLTYTGQSLDHELGHGWIKGVHPTEREYAFRIYSSAFEQHKPFRMEYRLKRHDGTYHWILSIGTPRKSTQGEFMGYIGSCVDIDEIKRSQRLQAINQTLKAQRSRLIALHNSKDEFISLASHQLRTPASGVKQYLGMLLEGYAGKLTEQQQNFLKIAYESNERQLTIINDLLMVAQIDADKIVLNRTPTDLVELVRTVVAEQDSLFKTRNQVVTLLTAKPQIQNTVDAARIRMVLENLIDNASKYSGENKTITININETPKDTVLSVKDSGVGIAKKDLDKLFQKFSRVHNPLSDKVGGSGLGLYWAKRIIDLHGGSIEVESRLRQGSTFIITLPKR
jgi:PAS domain S-box-containing protein